MYFLYNRFFVVVVLDQIPDDYFQIHDPDVAPLEINVGEIVHLLAKEEELVAARTKAENLERENIDLATELAKKVSLIWFFILVGNTNHKSIMVIINYSNSFIIIELG